MSLISFFAGRRGSQNRMLAGNLTHRCIDDVRQRIMVRAGQLPMDEARGYVRARARKCIARRMQRLSAQEQLSAEDAAIVQRLALDACVQVLLPQFVALKEVGRRAA